MALCEVSKEESSRVERGRHARRPRAANRQRLRVAPTQRERALLLCSYAGLSSTDVPHLDDDCVARQLGPRQVLWVGLVGHVIINRHVRDEPRTTTTGSTWRCLRLLRDIPTIRHRECE